MFLRLVHGGASARESTLLTSVHHSVHFNTTRLNNFEALERNRSSFSTIIDKTLTCTLRSFSRNWAGGESPPHASAKTFPSRQALVCGGNRDMRPQF